MQVHGDVATSVTGTAGAIPQLSLSTNYPNPFNPTTTVEFAVAANGRAVLRVFNLLGQEVERLFDEIATPGRQYRAVFDASRLPSGGYVVRLESAQEIRSQKMLLLK
jgi:hypothetical protein